MVNSYFKNFVIGESFITAGFKNNQNGWFLVVNSTFINFFFRGKHNNGLIIANINIDGGEYVN